MHSSPLIAWILLGVVGSVSGATISHDTISERTVLQGWSLQSNTCPSGDTACSGGEACCPSSLFCISGATDEVSACCQTNSACRGSIEGDPVCADSSWSLWKGFQGNSFCCQVGQIGIYYSSGTVAGSCAASVPAAATSAVLMSTGSGSSETQTSTTTSKPTTTATGTKSTTKTATTTTTTTTNTPGATLKPIFFHYLVGGTSQTECEKDIQDAVALGVTGFALNTHDVTDPWATDATGWLFQYANQYGFKLFFSFDMSWFKNPDQYVSYLQSYVGNGAYYRYNGLPFVSTFNGGASSYTFGEDSVNDGWKVKLQEVMANAGTPIYFVPAFQDVAITSSFFTTFPTLDGAMNWDSWPFNTQGDIIVPTTLDQTLQTAAKAAGKTFMMGLSPLQFKHIDSGDNWYRRGEQNLEYRFGQVLAMQPDFLEMQTWNDAGESHYMGNSWADAISGTDEGAYTAAYDHTGYWQILKSFITQYQIGATTTASMLPTNGAIAQGTFWHHTLLAAGTCPKDLLGPPSGVNTVEDRVTAVILVDAGHSGLTATVTSGTKVLGTQILVAGYNGFSFLGMTTGIVSVVVKNSAGTKIISGTGPIAVVNTASLCNYNFQVVGLA